MAFAPSQTGHKPALTKPQRLLLGKLLRQWPLVINDDGGRRTVKALQALGLATQDYDYKWLPTPAARDQYAVPQSQ